jgi:hypothetical protein
MAWSASAIFRTWPLAISGQGQTAAVLPAAYAGLGADTVKAALFNNSITPDKDATLATAGYNASTSQWLVANEVIDTLNTNWVAGGRTLASKTLTNPSTGVFMFDAADLAGAGNLTITNAFGCLNYDDTITAGTGGVADEGICYNYFGGAQTVTNGTFTIIWNANGIHRITT